jgi:NAD-dependent dihydropyrimidine dehydrogenase PreA subunit
MTTSLRYLPGVVTLNLCTDTCIGCGMCVEVCPHEVFFIENRKSRIIDRDACMECGACAKNCPVGAISVRSGVGCAAGMIAGKLGIKSACCGGDCQEKK